MNTNDVATTGDLDAAVAALRRLDARGLNRGSTGNLSLCSGTGMWITPSGRGAE